MADAPGEAAAPKSKLEEQATGKAELSYSYWAANTVNSAPPPEPKKLAEGEILPPPPHTEIGASAWNHAGTFEERDCTAWAKEQLGALLRAVEQQPGAGGVSVRITELASCNGEAHQWIFRQKKRAGFEFSNVQLKWTAVVEETPISGTAKIPHAAADDLEEGLQLENVETNSGDAEHRSKAQAAVRALLPALLEQAFRSLLERLCQK